MREIEILLMKKCEIKHKTEPAMPKRKECIDIP